MHRPDSANFIQPVQGLGLQARSQADLLSVITTVSSGVAGRCFSLSSHYWERSATKMNLPPVEQGVLLACTQTLLNLRPCCLLSGILCVKVTL